MTERPGWRALNHANRNERVTVHLGPRGYDMAEMANGTARLNAIEEAEPGPVADLRMLRLSPERRPDPVSPGPGLVAAS